MTLDEYNRRHEAIMKAWAADIRARRRNWYRLITISVTIGAVVGLLSWL